MLLLSGVIDCLHCSDASTTVQDELLEFGRYWATRGDTSEPLGVMAEWNREIEKLERLGVSRPAPGGRGDRILGREVYNDLFFPHAFERDGVHHVVFTAVGGPRSEQGVSTDFALLALAAYTAPEGADTLIEVCWSDGRRVQGFVDAATWTAANHFLDRIRKPRPRAPGPVCHRCQERTDCAQWAALSEVLFLKPPDRTQAKTEAHRLWLEWILLKELGKKTEARKNLVADRLMQLAVNGEVDVNGLLRLVVQAQDRTTWEFGQVHSLLQPAGLWSDKFARVQVTELKKATATFPPAVRQALDRLAKTETVEPSLREAAAGTERAVGDEKTSPFIGLHLRS